MTNQRAPEGSVILARDDHAHERGARAVHDAVHGALNILREGEPLDALVIKRAFAAAPRVAVIGKDSIANRVMVPHLCAWLLSRDSCVEKAYVGVEWFADVMNAEASRHEPRRFEAKCFGRPSPAGSYDLAWRLGALMDVDLVILLPDVGRMTMCEVLFAQECGLNVLQMGDAAGKLAFFLLEGD